MNELIRVIRILFMLILIIALLMLALGIMFVILCTVNEIIGIIKKKIADWRER